MAELVHVHKCMNMNRHALVWPRPSHILTFVPRRSPHRPSSKAGFQSWRHPLAPKLPTSRYHIPTPNQVNAVHAGDAQVASPMSKESPGRPQRGPRHPQPTWTYHQDQHQNQDLDLPQSFLPDVSEETCCWACTSSADRRYVPAAGTGDISTVCTTDLFPTVLLQRTFLHRWSLSELIAVLTTNYARHA